MVSLDTGFDMFVDIYNNSHMHRITLSNGQHYDTILADKPEEIMKSAILQEYYLNRAKRHNIAIPLKTKILKIENTPGPQQDTR